MAEEADGPGRQSGGGSKTELIKGASIGANCMGAMGRSPHGQKVVGRCSQVAPQETAIIITAHLKCTVKITNVSLWK